MKLILYLNLIIYLLICFFLLKLSFIGLFFRIYCFIYTRVLVKSYAYLFCSLYVRIFVLYLLLLHYYLDDFNFTATPIVPWTPPIIPCFPYNISLYYHCLLINLFFVHLLLYSIYHQCLTVSIFYFLSS